MVLQELCPFETKGQKVSKEVFPSLLGKLWDSSLKPSHCRAGFRGAGLVPYSREHVLKKLHHSAAMRAEKATFACCKCGHEMAATPIVKTRIVSYFAGTEETCKEMEKTCNPLMRMVCYKCIRLEKLLL